MPARRQGPHSRSTRPTRASRQSRTALGRPARARPPGRPSTRPAPVGARLRRAQGPVRFAVVGLGYFAQIAVLPAFRNAKGCRLTALVSDDQRKLEELGAKYDVPILASYDDYEELLASGEVDAVYIALPNDLHAEFTVRAARHGIHVLCEKPLADNARDAQRMVDACRRAGVRLMTAYRLHFEPANLRAIAAVQDGQVGEPRVFDSVFSMQVKPTGIRVEAERGGGPLFDIGIYCVNAARYLFRAEPTSVVAEAVEGKGRRFREVEEAVSAILTFPGGRTASFTASYGADAIAYYTLLGTTGYVCVDNAYEHTQARHLEVGGDGKRTRTRRYRKVDQVAPELMHFADCVRRGRDPEPSGREGLIDVRILEAIRRSARTGRRVHLQVPTRRRRPTPRQEVRVGRQRKPDLVNAQTPFR